MKRYIELIHFLLKLIFLLHLPEAVFVLPSWLEIIYCLWLLSIGISHHYRLPITFTLPSIYKIRRVIYKSRSFSPNLSMAFHGTEAMVTVHSSCFLCCFISSFLAIWRNCRLYTTECSGNSRVYKVCIQ